MRNFMTVMLLLAASTATAAEVVVFPASVVNLEAGDGDAIAAVVADAFAARLGDATVLGPIDAQDALEVAVGPTRSARAAAAARALGAERHVVVDAVRLGRRISLNARLFWRDGRPPQQAKIVASTMDDIQVAARRLTDALLLGRPTRSAQPEQTVARRGAKPRDPTFTERIVGLRSGLVVPFAGGSRLEDQGVIHFDVRLEAEGYFVEFGAGMVLPAGLERPGSYGGLFTRIGASYYLTDHAVAPYLGGGVEPRLHFGDDTGVGFAPYANLGLMFFRESSTRVFVDLQVAQNVLPIATEGGPFANEDDWYEEAGPVVTSYPTEVGLMFGVGW